VWTGTDTTRLLALSSTALAVAAAITALEFLSVVNEFGDRGVFSWRILKATGTKSRWVPHVLVDIRAVAAVLTVRLICAIVLLAGAVTTDVWAWRIGLAGILLTGMFVSYRCNVGLDGADGMTTVVSAGLFLAMVNPHASSWQLLGLGFIAGQSCLSYFTAGIAKLASPVWRSGFATYGIANTQTYGMASAATFLGRYPRVSLFASWGVIVFEILFPLSLLLPRPGLIVLLATGICFHVLSAIGMSLNVFVWSFVATYPAVWYCNHLLRQLLHT